MTLTKSDLTDLKAIVAMEAIIEENPEAEVQWGPEDINEMSFNMLNAIWSNDEAERKKHGYVAKDTNGR